MCASFFYLAYKKNLWEQFFHDFRSTVDEAHLVKGDLDRLMEKSLEVSMTVVDRIDNSINKFSSLQKKAQEAQLLVQEQIQEKNTAENKTLENEIQPQIYTARIRVYELARELNMNSRMLLKHINALGFNISNQLNCLDAETVAAIKKGLEELPSDNEIEGKLIPLPKKQHNVNDAGEDTNDVLSAHPYIAVKTLYEQGYAIRDIAKILGRGQGEVSLILNLINKKRASV